MDKETSLPYQGIATPREKELKKYRSKYNNQDEVSKKTLAALRSGEEWAYNEVYTRFALPLKDFLTVLIKNEEDAKELNHDVFLSLWTGREKIVPEKGIKGFLFMRARNLAMNYFDHKKVKDKYIDFCNRDMDYDFAPDQYMIGNETKILIDIALKGMTEQKRAIFKMKYEQGMTIDQIAMELNLSQSTVRNNLSIIVKSLRDIIAIYLILFLS